MSARKTKQKSADEQRLSRGRSRDGAIFPVAPSAASLPESYAATLQEIKSHLRSARIRAVIAANPIVIEAYWNTGRIILARQQEAAWGAKVIDRLASDLRQEFPDMGGLSSRNLLSMKLFAEAFPDGPIAKQPVSQLPWGQIIRLLQMVKDPATRDFTPGDVGQLNLYLSAVDDLLRHPDDQPTIGLLLCRKKNKLVAEYALRGLDQSIAVAEWQTQLTESLPPELASSLPSIEEIEAELGRDLEKEAQP